MVDVMTVQFDKDTLKDVHVRCVANVTTLGVGDDEVVGVVFLEIIDGLLEGGYALEPHALVECEVGLVSHTVGGRRIDDLLVELECGVFLFQQELWDLAKVCVESHA